MVDASSAVDVWNTVGTYLNTLVTAGLAVAIYRVSRRDEVGRLKAVLDSEREARADERAFALRAANVESTIDQLERAGHALIEAWGYWKVGEDDPVIIAVAVIRDVEDTIFRESLKLFHVPDLRRDIEKVSMSGSVVAARIESAMTPKVPITSWADDLHRFQMDVFDSVMDTRQRLIDYRETGKYVADPTMGERLARDPGAPVYPTLEE